MSYNHNLNNYNSQLPQRSTSGLPRTFTDGLRQRRRHRTYDYMEPIHRQPQPGDHTIPKVNADYMDGDQNVPNGTQDNIFYYQTMDNVAQAHERENARYRRLMTDAQKRRSGALGRSESESEDVEEDRDAWVFEMNDLQNKIAEAMADDPFDFPAIPPRHTGNCTPVGLIGYGMTMILLSLFFTGHYPLMTLVPSMCVTFGGFTQFISGILSWIQGNIFGYVSFLSWSCYFLFYALMWMLPNTFNGKGATNGTPNYTLGCSLLFWTIYCAFLCVCTFHMNIAVIVMYIALFLHLALLTSGFMGNHMNAIKGGGYCGVVSGAAAMYIAYSQLLNESYQRQILPVGSLSAITNYFGLTKADRESAEAQSRQEERRSREEEEAQQRKGAASHTSSSPRDGHEAAKEPAALPPQDGKAKEAQQGDERKSTSSED